MSAQLAPVDNLVDQEAVLKHLGLNPRDVHTQALLAICQRYRLDPLLKHVVLIQGRPYITRDGYLAIAHSSRQLDGIEVLEEGEDPKHWWAKVAVYRKDMSKPFAYRGRYPKEGSGNKQYGPEMAVKCAEVASLRRAFDVTGVGAADERWDVPEQEVVAPEPPAIEPAEGEVMAEDGAALPLQERLAALPTRLRNKAEKLRHHAGLPALDESLSSGEAEQWDAVLSSVEVELEAR